MMLDIGIMLGLKKTIFLTVQCNFYEECFHFLMAGAAVQKTKLLLKAVKIVTVVHLKIQTQEAFDFL